MADARMPEIRSMPCISGIATPTTCCPFGELQIQPPLCAAGTFTLCT